jgi:hypothetical protein
MNKFIQKISSLLWPSEPDFEHCEFEKFEDSLENFQIFYPSHWFYEKETAVIEGSYAIIFHSKCSPATMRIEVSMILPQPFGEKEFVKYAKNEIEKPTAGILSKARKTNLKNLPCVKTDYLFSDGKNKMYGEKIFIFAGDRVFNIFFICFEKDRERLKKIFSYILDSLVIKPRKKLIFV